MIKENNIINFFTKDYFCIKIDNGNCNGYEWDYTSFSVVNGILEEDTGSYKSSSIYSLTNKEIDNINDYLNQFKSFDGYTHTTIEYGSGCLVSTEQLTKLRCNKC